MNKDNNNFGSMGRKMNLITNYSSSIETFITESNNFFFKCVPFPII